MLANTNINDTYTDLSGLNAIKQVGRENTAAGLKQVANQFEALFVNMMLKSMRESNAVFAEGNYLNSNETEFYQQNFDNQLSVHLSNGKGLGLADVLYRQLATAYGIEVEEPAGARSTMVSSEFPFPTTRERADDFDSPQDFVNKLMPYAEAAADQLGVSPQALLAQSALETGWGSHMVRDSRGGNSFNLFGIKADAQWRGPVARTGTLEFSEGQMRRGVADFRRYQSYAESFADFAEFLRSNPRYQEALQGRNNEDFVQGLQKAGYATDPNYAKKILAVMGSDSMQSALSESSAPAGRGL